MRKKLAAGNPWSFYSAFNKARNLYSRYNQLVNTLNSPTRPYGTTARQSYDFIRQQAKQIPHYAPKVYNQIKNYQAPNFLLNPNFYAQSLPMIAGAAYGNQYFTQKNRDPFSGGLYLQNTPISPLGLLSGAAVGALGRRGFTKGLTSGANFLYNAATRPIGTAYDTAKRFGQATQAMWGGGVNGILSKPVQKLPLSQQILPTMFGGLAGNYAANQSGLDQNLPYDLSFSVGGYRFSPLGLATGAGLSFATPHVTRHIANKILASQGTLGKLRPAVQLARATYNTMQNTPLSIPLGVVSPRLANYSFPLIYGGLGTYGLYQGLSVLPDEINEYLQSRGVKDQNLLDSQWNKLFWQQPKVLARTILPTSLGGDPTVVGHLPGMFLSNLQLPRISGSEILQKTKEDLENLNNIREDPTALVFGLSAAVKGPAGIAKKHFFGDAATNTVGSFDVAADLTKNEVLKSLAHNPYQLQKSPIIKDMSEAILPETVKALYGIERKKIIEETKQKNEALKENIRQSKEALKEDARQIIAAAKNNAVDKAMTAKDYQIGNLQQNFYLPEIKPYNIDLDTRKKVINDFTAKIMQRKSSPLNLHDIYDNSQAYDSQVTGPPRQAFRLDNAAAADLGGHTIDLIRRGLYKHFVPDFVDSFVDDDFKKRIVNYSRHLGRSAAYELNRMHNEQFDKKLKDYYKNLEMESSQTTG